MAPKRNAKGQFVKGTSGNPRGRAPLPEGFKEYAEQAPAELWKMANDQDISPRVRADILKWMSEMWFGKAPQALDLDGKLDSGGTMKVKFEGKLAEWSE